MHKARMGHFDREWLQKRKKELGLTDESIAAAIGRDRTIVTKILGGKMPFDTKHLAAFAAVFQTRPETILFRMGVLKADPDEMAGDLPLDMQRAPDVMPTRNAESGAIGLRHLDMSLSMGDGADLDSYFEEGVFEFDAGLLRSISKAPPHRLVVGHGIGDSMTPTIHDDALVIFDTTQTKLNADDKIWAISLFGAGSIKRLQVIAKDRVLVVSDNPIVPNKEVSMEDLQIIGRVIWSARRH